MGVILLEGKNKDRDGGSNGCHARGQPILMFDGSIKKVEDIVVGDQLMGPDSTPRTVLELKRGHGKMVTIVPKKGTSFTVNEDHILTLVKTKYGPSDRNGGLLEDISVKEYLLKDKQYKTLHPLIRSGVEFDTKSLPIEPYFMGLLLGDGHLGPSVSITCLDSEEPIISETRAQAVKFGLSIRTNTKWNNKLSRYSRASTISLSGERYKPNKNKLTAALRTLGLYKVTCGDKFIPAPYKTGDRWQRLQVLAGLLDTDGSLAGRCYDFISKSERLSNDVAYVARSVGLAAYVKTCRKAASGTDFVGTYYRVSISGNTHIIPCRLPHKKATPGTQRKDRLRSGFTAVSAPDNDFYGFTLDKDGRYLMGDFTITHNSGKTSIFNSIMQILFAKNPTGESGNAVINRILGKAFGRVTFVDSNGVKWRVTDVKKWRKTDKSPDTLSANEPSWTDSYSGTDVYLDRWDGNMWVDERSSNKSVGEGRLDLKATRKRIVEILKVDYDRFMSISYLAQQQSIQFLNGGHKERMAILSELADLQAWDERVAAVRNDIKTAEVAESVAEQKLNTAIAMSGHQVEQSEIDAVSIKLDKLIEENDAATADLKTIDATNDAVDAAVAALASKTPELISRSSSLTITRNQLAQLLSQQRLAYKTELDAAKATPAPAEISEVTSRIAELKWQAISKTDSLSQMLTTPGRCAKCQSIVSDIHLDRHRDLIKAEIAELNSIRADLETELKQRTEVFDQSVADAIKAVELAHADVIHQTESSMREIDGAISQVGQELLDIEAARKSELSKKRSTQAAHTRLYNIMAEMSACSSKLEKLNTQREAWVKHQAQILAARSDIEAAATKIKYLKALDRLFGDKGVKAFKLDAALLSLNTLLQKYIGILTDDQVSLWISQYREKADGDLSTDIQIMVREGEKDGVPFALYSGGERQQMILAFIASFWELASNYGSGVNILCLDEIFGPLDESNAEKVFTFVDSLKGKGKSTIFVVTHDDSIRGRMPLDGIWTVVKLKHQSTIETN